jgi:CTP synthase
MDLLNSRQEGIKIVIAGKYTGLTDAYHSVIKGIQHAALHTNIKVTIQWVESSRLQQEHREQNASEYDEAWATLKGANGILVPGGYGNRGIEGKIKVAEYARTHNIPYFGICLGMQIAVIEFARHKLGWTDANSEEFDPESKHKVVVFMPEGSKTMMGGTMRLGARYSHFKKTCAISQLYERIWGDPKKISERHRHRYEVNPYLAPQMEAAGLCFVAQDDSGNRQEIIELDGHPYFVGVQYHPEMKTRPTKPSPPFVGLVLAGAGKLQQWREGNLKLGLPLSPE